MSARLKIMLFGAVLGFLETFTIWFVPEEPYPSFIVLAGVLNGALTALLISIWIDRYSTVRRSLAVGALCGLAMAGVVYLSKGAWISGDAPFVVPAGLLSGAIIGAGVRWLNTHG